MIQIISPEDSISYALAQKVPHRDSLVENYPDIVLILKEILQDLGVPHLLRDILSIKIVDYNYEIRDHDSKVYSFLVYDGQRGDVVPNKRFFDNNGNEVVRNYESLYSVPYIVLSKDNQKDDEFRKSSIIHEIAHVIYLIAQDDKFLEEIWKDIPPTRYVEKEEVYPMFLEVLFKRKEGRSSQDILNYLVDRYIPNFDENKELHKNYKKDLIQIVK